MIDDGTPIIENPNGYSPLGLNQKKIQVQILAFDAIKRSLRFVDHK
mgnify:CR=1 FL=1